MKKNSRHLTEDEKREIWRHKCRLMAAKRWESCADNAPKPVTLPHVSIQHVDMEKLP